MITLTAILFTKIKGKNELYMGSFLTLMLSDILLSQALFMVLFLKGNF